MGKGKQRNRPRAKQRNEAAVPASVDDLPDELLDRVLLDLDSPLDLIRAAATCRRWRRAVADDGFLARFYALHGAPRIAGHYYVTDMVDRNQTGRWCRPLEKTAAFVTTSPAVVDDDGRLFSLDFLYVPPAEGDRHPPRYMTYRSARIIRHNRCREIIDSRGSLLLLSNAPRWRFIDLLYWSPDFIVCEPATRRFQGITRPAADLGHLPFLAAFLLDGGGGSDTMSNFRLLCVLYERNPDRFQYDGLPPPRPSGKPRACVFSPGSDGGWTMCWDATDDDVVDVLSEATKIHLAGRAAGKIFWGTEAGDVLVLDESTIRFSLLTFPAAHMRWPYRRTSFRVIGGVDGGYTVRVVRMVRDDLEVFGQLPGSDQWVMEMRVRLSKATAGMSVRDHRFFSLPARIVTAGSSFVVLTPAEKTWLFSVDLETMELECEHERNRHVGPSYPCTLPWPPVLQACFDHAGHVGQMRQRCKG